MKLPPRYRIVGLVVSLITINFLWAIWIYFVSFTFVYKFVTVFLTWCKIVSYFVLVDGIYSILIYVECAKVPVKFKLVALITVVYCGLEAVTWYLMMDELYLATFIQELKGTVSFLAILFLFGWFKYKQWKKRQNIVQELELEPVQQHQNFINTLHEDYNKEFEEKDENPWKNRVFWLAILVQISDFILAIINNLAAVPRGLVIVWIIPLGTFSTTMSIC